MSKRRFRPIRMLLRLTIGGLFVYASHDKLLNPHAFADAVSNYQASPDVLIHPVALILSPLELLCGLLLIVGRWTAPACLWLTMMATVFIVAQAQALVRGLDITCGCFLVDSDSPVEQQQVVGECRAAGYTGGIVAL